MKRKTIVVGSLLLLVALSLVGTIALSANHGGARFETARIDRGPLVARVTATGTVSPLVTVLVGSQVSGRVAEILVNFNSEVKKGQILAKIDSQVFAALVAQAKAGVNAAQAESGQGARDRGQHGQAPGTAARSGPKEARRGGGIWTRRKPTPRAPTQTCSPPLPSWKRRAPACIRRR
ncbi:MAG: biotin/lipoyl-binding protein [Polyangiaceae bacterium]